MNLMTAAEAAKVERFLTPEEVAKRLQVHASTVRRLFHSEPGVLKLQMPSVTKRRQRISIRIPESVLSRWIAERSTGFVVEQRKRAV